MVVFAESSAVVKRYLPEAGSLWLCTTMLHARAIVMARATPVEVAAALSRRLPADAATALLLDRLRADCAVVYFVELTAGLAEHAFDLAQRYRLRGYDAVQLASALAALRQVGAAHASDFVLLSADRELNAAARAEGLVVADPLEHA